MIKQQEDLKISIIGLGYIGLPTAAILASRKLKVLGVDVNPNVVDMINRGEIHISEPDLDIIVHAVVNEGYLRASMKPEPSDVFLIAVPTPFKENYQPDLSFIKLATESIAPFLKKGDLVILESTSPVGTTEQLADWLTELREDLTFPNSHGANSDIRIAYCPERVLPGHILQELVQNHRIIGGMTAKCTELAKQFYQKFVEGDCISTNVRAAELCKLAENSFRDVNIAFANELANICDELSIDVWELIRLANHHPRVSILQPGPGVGGHCIAVDPWFIVSNIPNEAQLIKTARQVNDNRPKKVLNKIRETIADFLEENPEKNKKDVVIACLGLAFKADIDDLRESPAVLISESLAETHPGPVYVVEPNIQELPKNLTSLVELKTMNDALAEADILVILVNHKSFYDINFSKNRTYKIIDTKGLLNIH